MNKMIKISMSILLGILIFYCGCGATPEKPDNGFDKSNIPAGATISQEKKPEVIKGPLTLDSLIEYMEANNPELKSLSA
jgi:hypothetical protein